MKRLTASLLLGLGILFATNTPAFADEAAPGLEATPDTVHLRNGGLLRGRVTEIVPGDHVTVLMVGGEQKRIPWIEVDRVVVATDKPQPQSSGPAPLVVSPPSTSEAAAPPMVGPRVRVRLRGTGTLYLYRKPAGASDFVKACESPCDMDVPVGDTYKVGGSGVTTTKEFRIDQVGDGRYVEITVDGPSYVGIVGGGLMTIVGGLTAYVGLVFTLAGSSSSSSSTGEEIRNIGIGALLVGSGLIALGLVIVFPSLKTDLSQETKTISKDGFLRRPQWKTIESAGLVPQATFPVLFERSF